MKKTLFIFGLFAAAANYTVAQNSCATAIEISAGTYSFSQIEGTNAPSPVCSSGGTGATAGRWYKYTAPSNLQLTVTSDYPAINGNTDNRVQIYSGTCAALVCVAGDDDSGTDLLCVATLNVTAGTTYYIAFDNRWSNNGFTFALLEDTTPPTPEVSFVTQPFANILGQYKIAIADMNGDFLDDIVSVSSSTIHILYQQADGSFSPAAINVTPAQFLPTWSLAIGDVNKDGFNDLMYGNGNGVSFYYSNSTGTAYTHWALSNYVFSQRTNFIDINNDGHLDAFVCHDVAPNVYYLNDGNNNLSFNQGGFGDHSTGGHYATIWFDYDNDGDVDMFISKCSGGGQGQAARFNEMHRNNGDGTFTNVSVEANMNHGNQTWSSAVNDFDNDGFMDVIVGVSNFQNDGTHLFMRNNGDGTFTDIAAGSGWDTYTGTSIEFVSYDFNNDGWADVLTNAGSQGKIFLNNGDNTFTIQNITATVGAVGDLNNDGFLDIQNGNNVFYNQPNGNNWVKMNLKGIQSNSNGIGARVEIYGAWGKQIRDVQSGIGFRHMGTLNPHFGIGQATAIDSVIVRWPSGQVDMVCNPAINTTLMIQEGNGNLPQANFVPSATEVSSGEVVSFDDASTNCPTVWSWEVEPATGWNFVNSTDASSVNPEIQFNNYGLYTVSLVVSNPNGVSANVSTAQVMVGSGVGLENYNNNDLNIFPNPTSGELNLEFIGNMVGAKLTVISTIGVEVMHFETLPNSIDASGLSSGTYFILLALPNGSKITKLFVKN
jgi:PKD repeat protein